MWFVFNRVHGVHRQVTGICASGYGNLRKRQAGRGFSAHGTDARKAKSFLGRRSGCENPAKGTADLGFELHCNRTLASGSTAKIEGALLNISV
jgi:hypothetical protein